MTHHQYCAPILLWIRLWMLIRHFRNGIQIDSITLSQADTDEVCYTSDGDLKNLDKQPYCDEVDNYREGCLGTKDASDDTVVSL